MEMITRSLLALKDEKYKQFLGPLVPTAAPDTVIGVRTPELRKLARELGREPRITEFLDALPHGYYEENNLHVFIIGNIRDFRQCLARVEQFLPFVDNWATCDSLRPKCFGKNKQELLKVIPGWLLSDHPYTVRFGIEMLMVHFLDSSFEPRYLELAASVRGGEYYVDMMIAWYFATALAKQWEAALPWLEKKRLPSWVHNKTIQKAVESLRITPEQKEYLKTLKAR